MYKATLAALCFASAAGCTTTTKPCSEGGDVKWVSTVPVRGIKRCLQRKFEDGKFANHGQYEEVSDSGKILLEGQFFEGKKDGTWTQYDEKGNKILERYFDRGIEKMAPVQKPQ